jgi:hypothetical protein
MKKKISALVFVQALFFALGLLLAPACVSTNNDDLTSPVAPSDHSGAPFTEAYIEYPGPNDKWSGPQNFVVHIQTRGTTSAQITIVPKQQNAPTQGGTQAGTDTDAQIVPIEMVRDQLARLSAAIQEKENTFRPCLYPVRVNLIRSDGALVERQGCRGNEGWPRVASEVVNHLMEMTRIKAASK